jgi:hypothetical protein
MPSSFVLFSDVPRELTLGLMSAWSGRTNTPGTSAQTSW